MKENIKIFLIPHFHYDTIYQDTYENYLEKSFCIIKKAIEILKIEKKYKFLIEQTILLEEFWKREPQYRQELYDLIKQNRIEFSPGFFVMPDMNLISGESLIRQIKRGKEILKKFNIQPKVAWISDCWGHHRQIPQILKKAGYIGYAFSRGMIKEISPSLQFYWEGIDKTEIPTVWMATGYFGFFVTNKKNIEDYFEEIEKHIEILKKFKSCDLILLPNGGDFIMPDFKIIEIIEEWNRQKAEKIFFATTSEYFEELKEKKLPIFNYDFNPMFNGTYTSRIEIKQSNRKLENQIYLLELLESILEMETEKENIKLGGKIDNLEYYLLFNQFHDIICGSILDEGYIDVMENYKHTQKIFDEVFTSIIDQMTIPEKNTIAIFNQCSFSRKDICFFELDIPEDKDIEIYDKEKRIKTQIFNYDNGRALIGFKKELLHFTRENLKYKIVKKKERKIETLPFKFKNKYFIVQISDIGLISNLKVNGKELINQEKPYFGELIFQRDMGDFWVYYQSPVAGDNRFSEILDDPYPENVPIFKEAIFQHNFIPESISLEKGDIGIKIEIKGKIQYWKTLWRYIQTCFIYYELPFIDYKIKFFAEGKNYRIRVAFPTTIKKGKIRREIPFGIEFQKEGEYPSYNFIDYYDNEKGLCVLNKGTCGNSVKNGVIMLSLFRAVDMGPNKAKSETGFCSGQVLNFEYRVLPLIPESEEYKPYLYGISFNNPPVIIPGVKFKNKNFCFKISPENIPITSIKKIKSNIYLIRIYEPEGKKQKVKIETEKRFEFFESSIDGMDIREKIGEGENIIFLLKPFEIKTLIISLLE
ncbi:MAG: hypothetical protein NC833_03250 [Candidatus Omnitrophica bacterium]|nr:hypothetical protein [Candidatus Omnitrophota bacterium]